MGGCSKEERSFLNKEQHVPGSWDKRKHDLFKKLRGVLRGQMIQKQGRIVFH